MKNMRGGDSSTIQVRDDVFSVPMNAALVHQVAVGQRANSRQGTSATQSRSDVSVSGRKPFTQKHTGRARQGSASAPNLRGGSVAFGPKPRSYKQNTPKKMRRGSIKILLSQKVRDGELIVVEDLDAKRSKTSDMVKILGALGVSGSTLMVLDGVDSSVIMASRNIPRLKMLPASLLNTVDLLSHSFIVMTIDAVKKVEEVWGGVMASDKVLATVPVGSKQ